MNTVSETIRNILTVIAGMAIYAVGVCFFIVPSGLITGGTTGIALIANHFLGISISPIVGVFNIAMFILGFVCFGKKFALNTLVGTVSYPVLLGIIQSAIGDFVLTDDILICALFGGLCIGLSLAMVLRIGASTGGMDIPPLMLQKFCGIPVSVSLYVFDFVILVGQMLYSDARASLYGILLVIVYTLTLDKLLAIGESRSQVQIVSEHCSEVKAAIIRELDRGVTLLHGQTGYLGVETDIVQCVVAPRELHRVEKLVHSVDPEAFVVMSKVTSVKGRGFSSEKIYLDR